VAAYCYKQATANNSVMEAMSCGVPVVATDIGGIREYTGPHPAILCPQWDPESIAAGILRIFRDRAEAARMRKAARERAVEFDYRVMARNLSRAYEQVARADR
jgi:glycosyltransferase involved in cell wall biosynthesis